MELRSRTGVGGRLRQRGVSAVELALILPLMLIILFGAVELGSAFWRKQILTSAVREGARKGIVATSPRKTTAEIQNAVNTYLTGVGWNAGLATVVVTGAGGAAGTPLTVQATYPTSLRVLSKLMPKTFAVNSSGNVTLTAKVVMQME